MRINKRGDKSINKKLTILFKKTSPSHKVLVIKPMVFDELFIRAQVDLGQTDLFRR